MATMLSGLLGGLVGAVATGAMLLATGDEPSPAAVVWAKYLGDGDPANYETHGLAVHLVYGAVAGVLFVAVAGALSLGVGTLGGALLWAVVWAAVLVVVAAGFWMKVALGADPDTEALSAMGLMHLVYGVALGVVVYLLPGL